MITHWLDVAAIVFSASMGLAGIITNSVLVALTVYCTPKNLKTHSAIFVVSAIGGILAGLGGICTQTRTIPYENVTVFKFHGPSILIISSQEVNANICMFWYNLQVFTGMILQALVIFSVIFRAIMFKFSMDSVKKSDLLYPLSVFGLIWIAAALITFFFTLKPYNQINATVFSTDSSNFENGSVYYALDNLNFPQNVLDIQRYVFPCFVFFFTVLGRWFISYQLDYYMYSISLKKHHTMIAKALLAQCIPAIFSILINIIYLKLSHPQARPVCENLLNLPIVFMSFVNPAVTIYFINHYRAKVSLFIKKKTNSSVVPTTNILPSWKQTETMRF